MLSPLRSEVLLLQRSLCHLWFSVQTSNNPYWGSFPHLRISKPLWNLLSPASQPKVYCAFTCQLTPIAHTYGHLSSAYLPLAPHPISPSTLEHWHLLLISMLLDKPGPKIYYNSTGISGTCRAERFEWIRAVPLILNVNLSCWRSFWNANPSSAGLE